MKRLQPILLIFATAFWGYYLWIHKMPLNADEIYFAHVFWMLRDGQVAFVNFHSRHLPYYFDLLAPMLPDGEGPEFIWVLRASCVPFLAAYLFMVRPSLWPALLMFVIFGRMTEIRPDTVGLLLFNLAWLLLLKDRKHATLAAILAAGALFFSARAAIMIVPIAALCLYLSWPRIRGLFIAGIAFLAVVGALWAADPAYADLVVRGVYLDHQGFSAGGDFARRFLEAERALLLLMILTALGVSITRLRSERNDRDVVIGVACASQVALIILDPDPYGYAYSWAAIPTLAGLPSLVSSLLPTATAVLVFVASVTTPLWRRATPPPGHVLSLTMAPGMSREQVASATTAELAASLMRGMSLDGQLRSRWELCRRLRGEVTLSYFWYHPICMRDALHDWFGMRWPNGFEKLKAAPPALIVWGERGARPVELLQGHDDFEGFAIRKSTPIRRPVAGKTISLAQ